MRRAGKTAPLGHLEELVMEVLWRGGPATVREVARQLGKRRAYTTVMTTLDRLHRKGLTARDKDGNAFQYRAALTRDEFHRAVVESTVSTLLAKSTDPVLAGFVDAAASLDEKNLARLEQLIARKRRRP
jgi:predicted transcriptional regulator